MIAEVLVRADSSARMPQFSYDQCLHLRLKRDGFRTLARGKVQRWQCAFCPKVFLEGAHRPDLVAMGRALLADGATTFGVAARYGVSVRIVRALERMLRDRRPACPCGRPASHQGRCKARGATAHVI